jgi:hypothetical protein
MVTHPCTKSAEIDKLDKAVFNSGHGLIQNTATILQKVENLEQRIDGVETTVKDTQISMHLIEIAVARIEQKLSDQKEKKEMSWQKTVLWTGSILSVAAIIASIIFKS